MPAQEDFAIKTLGPCTRPSPLSRLHDVGFVEDDARILYQHKCGAGAADWGGLCFEEAGPRASIYFDPAKTTAAVVTCGGLSPGLNNVIRSVYCELAYNYLVPRVLGVRNGYMGLNPDSGLRMVELTPAFVDNIHYLGGTVLGSSRGSQEVGVIVDTLVRDEIDILFCVGGDGTQRGAAAISDEVERRGLKKAVVGIPKTIDNDLHYVYKSFGYDTALEKAEEVLRGAHVEARCAPNGIGLVKLMGRNAGFIAAGAALASQDANFVLIPEIPFRLEGEDGFLTELERRVLSKGHALVVVAEGAGQDLFTPSDTRRDASGNVLHDDIGILIRDHCHAHFKDRGIAINLKYIDPSYYIRSTPANAGDRILSDQMARMAVHAAMAGKTDTLIGYWHNELVHVPIRTAIAEKRQLDLTSDLWTAVMRSTGQPVWRV
ncbi:Pyrophosphate--fructose 6-phosphate 1-phosphotransferase [Aquisphaera giovannonii]|uniref:Pyrophosphate--fructose 6-phosphate 1-phosphotransferase n=1 Tax=Aquisphaera giovannonii TaxID=406548 RepID=A0A5B9VZ82_9BACT|nr:ATP-dependent 6-phosphofructokinase [Aquisphaera giovannonii]QEH33633.1 Pyrophosphate--fructose 6-phosphate 1-phosphotransferase [Aquisphaera giovannonii]